MRRTAPTRVAIAELSASAPMRTATSNPSSTRSTGRSSKRERDEHLGKSIEKFRDDRQHVQPPEQDRRSQAQLAARRRALARTPPARSRRGRRARAWRRRETAVPASVDADRARGAGEQPHAEPRFQFGDRPGDRGGRAVQPPRGLREAAAVGHLDEDGDAIDPIHTVAYYRNNQLQKRQIIISARMAILRSRGRCSGGPCDQRQPRRRQ